MADSKYLLIRSDLTDEELMNSINIQLASQNLHILSDCDLYKLFDNMILEMNRRKEIQC